jgi:hypothetical protein
MNNSRIISRPRPAAHLKSKGASESSGKRKWLVLAALFLVICGLGAWAMASREDPQVTKVKELRVQLENADDGQRRELWGQMREEMEKLPEQAREEIFADRRKEWEARANKQMTEFFAKPKAEQIALIDKQIDESERRRADRSKRAQGGQAGRQPGQGGRGGPGGGWGGRGGRNSDPAARSARGKQRLDSTTPESRAQRSEYRRMMDERRTQRGLPT